MEIIRAETKDIQDISKIIGILNTPNKIFSDHDEISNYTTFS